MVVKFISARFRREITNIIVDEDEDLYLACVGKGANL